MNGAQVLPLEGWLTFNEAASLLGITKQGMHKFVFTTGVINVDTEVRRIGSHPLLVIRAEAVRRELHRRGIETE